MNFKKLASFALVLSFALSVGTSVFAATETYKTIGKADAPQGGSFTYNLRDEPTTLNPINYTDAYSRRILEYNMSYLMVRNQNTWKYEPSLAEKVDISKDGLV